MNKKTNLAKGLFTFLGVICFTFLLVVNEASADSLSNEIDNNLIKIATQGIDAEIYVDPTETDNVFFFMNGSTYKIKDNKLAKDTSSTLSGNIGTYATDTYKVTLKNGYTNYKVKRVSKGTTMMYNTYGPAELREIQILKGGNSGTVIAKLKKAEYGVGTGITASGTDNYSFKVTNYSATTQTWECKITF